jgi:hypothetical protein
MAEQREKLQGHVGGGILVQGFSPDPQNKTK